MAQDHKTPGAAVCSYAQRTSTSSRGGAPATQRIRAGGGRPVLGAFGPPRIDPLGVGRAPAGVVRTERQDPREVRPGITGRDLPVMPMLIHGGGFCRVGQVPLRSPVSAVWILR